MNGSFEVDRIAVHLIDRTIGGVRYSEAEVDLADFVDDDRDALDQFFEGHLSRVWKADEGERTRAAVLQDDSVVKSCLDEIQQDASSFFEQSKRMADRLYGVASRKNTTPGLLMVLRFRRMGEKEPYLGLLKMDPGKSDLVMLQTGEAGQYLLELAVEHLEHVLPDREADVLKWAVLPHPTRPRFGVKLKDQEGGADLAIYFQEFLGCKPRLSPKQQARVVIEEVAAYAEEYHESENWRPAVVETIDGLRQETRVDVPTVERQLRQSGLRNVRADAFRDRLRRRDAEDLDFSAETLRKARLAYVLDNNIVIRGPLDVMESAVEVHGEEGDWEIVIRTPGYRTEYV